MRNKTTQRQQIMAFTRQGSPGLARFPALNYAPGKINRPTACLIKSGITRRHTAHAGRRITMAIGTGLHGR